MNTYTMNFREWLSSSLADLGMNPTNLAKESEDRGLNQPTLSRILAGKQEPSEEVMQKIAEAVQVEFAKKGIHRGGYVIGRYMNEDDKPESGSPITSRLESASKLFSPLSQRSQRLVERIAKLDQQEWVPSTIYDLIENALDLVDRSFQKRMVESADIFPSVPKAKKARAFADKLAKNK